MAKVLLIEDNPDDCRLMLIRLGKAGFEVTHCTTQRSAYRTYRDIEGDPFFAIILDGFVPTREEGQRPKKTIRLLRLILHKGFCGHVMAVASDLEVRQEQVDNGATFSSEKHEVYKHLKRLYGEAF